MEGQLFNSTTKSQEENILRHLQSGQSINPMQALRLYGSFRLGARIFGLRQQGYNIVREMVSQNGKKFASYKLVAESVEV